MSSPNLTSWLPFQKIFGSGETLKNHYNDSFITYLNLCKASSSTYSCTDV